MSFSSPPHVKSVKVREHRSGKGTPWQGCSLTDKGNQCDQCKFGKRQEAEGERDDGAVDEHPNILPSNILGGYFREAEVEGYVVRRVYMDEGSSVE
ncbi:hypothetical protein Tco_0197390, partial [Tanacetum coccineum]